MAAVRDEDPCVHLDGRQRGAATVEYEQLRVELRSEPRAFEHVRPERSAREPSPRSAAADRRDTGERGGLEMVGGGVPARARECDQVVERRRRLDELRLRRSAAAHRHDDDATVAGEDAGDVARHRGLPDPLAQADHGERRSLDRIERSRVESEVGADVGQPEGECAGGPEHALTRPEHGLVGQVDHEIDLGRVETLDERHPVVVIVGWKRRRRSRRRPAG